MTSYNIVEAADCHRTFYQVFHTDGFIKFQSDSYYACMDFINSKEPCPIYQKSDREIRTMLKNAKARVDEILYSDVFVENSHEIIKEMYAIIDAVKEKRPSIAFSF